tara:strand:+ start:610 stop:1266 length:657 start_codon:yes stop_codon:yes gene_type:complete
MLLYTENIETPLTAVTEDVDGVPQMYLEGIFMQADIKNRNNRVYPLQVLQEAVSLYDTNYVSKNRAVGELNHPTGPRVNLDKVSHMITSLMWEGTNVRGKALILDKMPMGLMARNLMEGGVQLGVSSRGVGDIDKSTGAMRKFIATAVDIVHDPSAPDTFINGVMEGVEYEVEGGNIVQAQLIEHIKKTMHNAPARLIKETQTACFEHYMASLKFSDL